MSAVARTTVVPILVLLRLFVVQLWANKLVTARSWLQRRRAPSYLADYCVPVSTVPGRQHLRSASRRQLIVPRVRRNTFGARAFAVAGPTVWNSLPDSLRNPANPAVGPDQFRRDLKTHLFV